MRVYKGILLWVHEKMKSIIIFVVVLLVVLVDEVSSITATEYTIEKAVREVSDEMEKKLRANKLLENKFEKNEPIEYSSIQRNLKIIKDLGKKYEELLKYNPSASVLVSKKDMRMLREIKPLTKEMIEKAVAQVMFDLENTPADITHHGK